MQKLHPLGAIGASERAEHSVYIEKKKRLHRSE
jgi:hypothetical protein